MEFGNTSEKKGLSRLERRQNRIARRLARRAIRAYNKGNTEVDVRGPLNIKRKYKKLDYNGYTNTKDTAPARHIYSNAVYNKVNSAVANHGLSVERDYGRIAYLGVGCYLMGHNNETVKGYDVMVVSRKQPPENLEAQLPPSDPHTGIHTPDHMPQDWAQPIQDTLAV